MHGLDVESRRARPVSSLGRGPQPLLSGRVQEALRSLLDNISSMQRRRVATTPEEEDPLMGGKVSSPTKATAARNRAQRRCKPQLACAVYVVFGVLPVINSLNILPGLVWKLLLVAGLGVFMHRVLTFKRWSDEYPYVKRFLICFSAMLVELLWENTMVWVVSALDKRKYDDPPGLQDNIEIAGNWLGAQHPLLEWLLNVHWSQTPHYLGVVLALAFSAGWDQHPYSGFGVMARFSLTICFSRLIRVASFMSTVLPSPRPGCYRRRFPPPPDTFWGILKVGIKDLRGTGGCNDLVFSGHGAFWTMGPLVYGTYYPGYACNWLLWVALVQVSIKDVLDKQHYGVDMVLAPVVTAAMWTWVKWVYPEDHPLRLRPADAPADALSPWVVALIVFSLTAAAVIIFVAEA